MCFIIFVILLLLQKRDWFVLRYHYSINMIIGSNQYFCDVIKESMGMASAVQVLALRSRGRPGMKKAWIWKSSIWKNNDNPFRYIQCMNFHQICQKDVYSQEFYFTKCKRNVSGGGGWSLLLLSHNAPVKIREFPVI